MTTERFLIGKEGKEMKQELKESALLKYGFEKKADVYYYKTLLSNSSFFLEIFYQKKELYTKIYDSFLKEEYLPFYITNYSGTFLSSLHKEVEDIIEDIQKQCSLKEEIIPEILNFVGQKYGTLPKYPWKGDSNYCTLTNSKNKWYALIMKLSPKVIGLEGKEKIYLLNLKHLPQKIDNIIDYERIFPAYHMNKKHWITINLNSNIHFDRIKELIEESYTLVNS